MGKHSSTGDAAAPLLRSTSDQTANRLPRRQQSQRPKAEVANPEVSAVVKDIEELLELDNSHDMVLVLNASSHKDFHNHRKRAMCYCVCNACLGT